ncbi:hypothetical protein GOV13_03330 [Candidatus Pacearchaeota archaeon]|nr:hypothetical protein [Candidatus Pacearchaeota archaeon]
MATTDTKDEIILILKRTGPSLPVHIAKELELSILFTSAYLSELLSEKRIKISYMRVGSSPVYFIPGQEPGLEKYSQHLKSKEKEAFMILKQKKFLKDDVQLPAIRVAIRAINDFAIPFKQGEELFWRFFTVSESEFKEPTGRRAKPEMKLSTSEQSEPVREEGQGIQQEIEEKSDDTLNIFDEKTEEPKKPLHHPAYPKEEQDPKTYPKGHKLKEGAKKKVVKKKAARKKQDNKFFIKVKEFLTDKDIEISDIEGFSKSDLTLRVNIQGEEKLLIAYNKKRIIETDITKAHKKASELNLPYIVLSLGEPLKKLSNLIEAVQNLEGIEKIE